MVPPGPGGSAQRTPLGNGYVVIENRVSGAGALSSWVVRPDGRRVTVQLPRGTSTPDNVAAVAQAVTDLPVRVRSGNH